MMGQIDQNGSSAFSNSVIKLNYEKKNMIFHQQNYVSETSSKDKYMTQESFFESNKFLLQIYGSVYYGMRKCMLKDDDSFIEETNAYGSKWLDNSDLPVLTILSAKHVK